TATFAHQTTVTFDQPTKLVVDGNTETVPAHTTRVYPAGASIPQVVGGDVETGLDWLLPRSIEQGDRGLLATYSLLLATLLGTMGLPHVLVRFYTNRTGGGARRTTLVVLGLVGLFYLLPTLYGVLGRVYTPQLMMTGEADAVVLLLPAAALGAGPTGQILG